MKILVIVGPTGVGKSDLAVELALKFKGEVISADSRQIYEGLDIGTGKITKEEMRGIPHHLLSEVKPSRQFSVAEFKILAEKKIADITKRGKLPLVCGGTGFYIQAIVDNLLLPEVLPDKTLRNELEKKTSQELFKILYALDPKRASKIDAKNTRRLIRAIEIAESKGAVPALVKKERCQYEFLQIGLYTDAETLKRKIHERLIMRLKRGMITEAEKLLSSEITLERMQELGLDYRCLANFLEKKVDRAGLVKCIEDESWKYAKRQATWFKRDSRVKWFRPEERSKIEEEVKKFVTS